MNKTRTLRKTFDAIVQLSNEPRFSDGVPPLAMAEPVGFAAVSRLASLLSVLQRAGAKSLEDDAVTALCEIADSILERARNGALQRRAEQLLTMRSEGAPFKIEAAKQLWLDLAATVTNTIERRVTDLRSRLESCPEYPGLRVTVTKRRYRIEVESATPEFHTGQLLPLLWWMNRPAWRSRIGCRENPSLSLVHENFRHALTTGLLFHDDGRRAAAIPKLDSIPDPAVRAALQRALAVSAMFSRILITFYAPLDDRLVLLHGEHGTRVALFLSAARRWVVDTVNDLLPGWSATGPPVEYLGWFPHHPEPVRVPPMNLKGLELEFGVLLRLGLGLAGDAEMNERRPGPDPSIADRGDSVPPPC